MGMVISFPASQRLPVSVESVGQREPGQVVILPVIRIERFCEQPNIKVETEARRAPARKRRRRVSRS